MMTAGILIGMGMRFCAAMGDNAPMNPGFLL